MCYIFWEGWHKDSGYDAPWPLRPLDHSDHPNHPTTQTTPATQTTHLDNPNVFMQSVFLWNVPDLRVL